MKVSSDKFCGYMEQAYVENSIFELSDKFRYKSSIPNFNNICETVCSIHGRVHLLSYKKKKTHFTVDQYS
jgi:hypothetical protein